jgi:excisionase family DNA binding protein
MSLGTENGDANTPAKSCYTVREAACRLNMSEKSVRRLIDRGHLRRCKVFGRVLIPCKDVDGFMDKFSAYAV